MLKVQQYLRAGHTLEDIQRDYALKTVRHREHPNLVLFKYSMVDSPMGEELVQECRGLILDEKDNWRVISYPFKKFFNWGEGGAANIDWSTAKVQEKLDGSLIGVYWYDGQWHIQTSGMPDASGEVNGIKGYTFADLFQDIVWMRGYTLPKLKHVCYMFELVSPLNRVVVHQTKPQVYWIGARHLETLQELDVYAYPRWPDAPPIPRTWDLRSLDEVIATFEQMDPLQQEGYVIIDSQFNRIKVKHPGYVALHHLKSGFNPRAILEIIRHGEDSEVCAHFPEWTSFFEEVDRAYRALVSQVDNAYQAIHHIENQKDFALEAQKTACPGALFALRSGRVKSAKEYFVNLPIKRLEALLDINPQSFILPGSGV